MKPHSLVHMKYLRYELIARVIINLCECKDIHEYHTYKIEQHSSLDLESRLSLICMLYCSFDQPVVGCAGIAIGAN